MNLTNNRLKRGVIGAMVFLCIMGVVFIGVHRVSAESAKKVLYLSSYAYDWESIPPRIEGIKDGLGNSAVLNYYFMDTKNIGIDAATNMLTERITAAKDAGTTYDVVIVGDDAALSAVMAQRDALFGDTPIVFEGINNAATGEAAAADGRATGVIETFPIADTIALAQAINPKATKVVGISDGTASGIGSTKQFLEAKSDCPGLAFSTFNCSEKSANQIKEEIAKYGDDTILFFLLFGEDGEGNRYTLKSGVEMLSQNATQPLYKSDEVGIDYGLLGGRVISYKEMGRKAGQMASQILSGTDVSTISLETCDDYAIFNAQTMKRFKINKNQLPEDAVYVDQDTNIWTENRQVLIPAIIIVLVLLVVAIVLFQENRRHRQLLDKLTLNERMKHIAMDTSGLIFWLYDYEKDIIDLQNEESSAGIMFPNGDHYPQCIYDNHTMEPESEERFRKMIEKLKAGASDVDGIFRVMVSWEEDGWHWMQIHFHNLHDGPDQPYYAVGTAKYYDSFVEMKDRYQGELEKRRVMEQSITGFMRFNVSLDRLEDFDAERLGDNGLKLGMPMDKAIKNLADRIANPVEYQNFKAAANVDALKRAFEEGRTESTFEFRLKLLSGEIRWNSITINLVTEPGLDVLHAFIYTKDIQEEIIRKKIMEESMQEEIDSISYMELSTGKTYFIKDDPVGMPKYDCHSMDAQDIQEAMVALHVHPADVKRFEKNTQIPVMQAKLARNSSFRFNFRVLDETNRCWYKTLRIQYLANDHDNIIMTQLDNTAMMNAERQKQAVLKQALDAAKQASVAKSEFLARMSHEIRTPMNAITGFVQMAKDKHPRPEIAEDLIKIETSSHVLLGILNDVLDMSAIESNKIKIAVEPFSLKAVLAALETVFGEQCRKKGVDFVQDDSELNVDGLMGDRLRINQILFNLLSNAIKFTENGSVRLSISNTTPDEDGNLMLNMVVADSGIGMNEDMVSRLFQPFEQQSTETAIRHGGSGLGLSITHRLIGLMEGTITVDTVEGKGTAFSVSLPLTVANETVETEAPGTDDIMDCDFSAYRVLVVDDNIINMEVAKGLLEPTAITCDEAEDGQVAVKIYTKAPPKTYQAILMDVQMPVMDGYTAARAIRDYETSHPVLGHVPIIAMTADAFTQDIARAKEAGMDDHIAKPIEVTTLYSVLKKHLKS